MIQKNDSSRHPIYAVVFQGSYVQLYANERQEQLGPILQLLQAKRCAAELSWPQACISLRPTVLSMLERATFAEPGVGVCVRSCDSWQFSKYLHQEKPYPQ